MKDSKNYVIAALCLVLCIMAVGFAAFSSNLNVNATATIGSKWKVKFAQNNDTNVGTVAETGLDNTNNYSKCVLNTATGGVALDSAVNTITVDSTTVTMSASLNQPGDSVTCYAVIANEGSIDAKLDSVNPEVNGTDDYIEFTRSFPANGTALNAGDATVISVTATYKSTAQGTPSTENYSATYSATLNYSQKTGA